jgi:hypothetical protein
MSYNPIPFTMDGSAPLHFPAESGATVDAVKRPSVAQELTSWLSALPHFFELKNHPLFESGGLHILDRNYIAETLILKQVLRRCLHLCLISGAEEQAGHMSGGDGAILSSALTGELMNRKQDMSLAPIWTRLGDLYDACHVLCEARKIDLRSWLSLGTLLGREFEDKTAHGLLRQEAPGRNLRHRLSELCRLLESACAHDSVDDVCSVLDSFAHCLDQLSLVSLLLTRDRPLKMTLPLFTHVHGRARTAVATLEKMALKAAADGAEFYEVFDSAGYAVGMELNKVFSHELVGLAASRHPPTIYAKIENSHGLLRDCFQQTILSLAQAFDPTLDRAKIFDTLDTKLQQSLRLRADLWAISELIRRAEHEHKPLVPLVARLQSFQQGAMRHLMYKDWESFERFVAEISAARGAAELGPVLHRFATYLDALFNQISMRVVLADYPFDYPPIAD